MSVRNEMIHLLHTHLPVDPYEYRNIGNGHALPVGKIALHLNAGAIPFTIETWPTARAIEALERRGVWARYPEEKHWSTAETASVLDRSQSDRRIFVARDPDGDDFLIDGGLTTRHAHFVKRATVEAVAISQFNAMLTLPENTGVAQADGRFTGLARGSRTLEATMKLRYAAGRALPRRWHPTAVPVKNPAHQKSDCSQHAQRIGLESVANFLQLHAVYIEMCGRGIAQGHVAPNLVRDTQQSGLNESEFFARLEYKGAKIKSVWPYDTIRKHKIAPALRASLGLPSKKEFLDRFAPRYAALCDKVIKVHFDVLLRRQYVLGITWNQICQNGSFVVDIFNQEERSKGFNPKTADEHLSLMYQQQAHAPLEMIDLYAITESTGINVAEYFTDFQRSRGVLDWVALLHDIKTGLIRIAEDGTRSVHPGEVDRSGTYQFSYDRIPVTPGMAAQWLRFRALSFAGPIKGPNSMWMHLFKIYEKHGDIDERDRLSILALRQYADYAKANSEYGTRAR